MKKLFAKDKKKRKNFKLVEENRFILHIINKNSKLKKSFRFNAHDKMFIKLKFTSRTKISNRCVLTYNKKKTTKISKFSRMIFLKSMREGFISGFIKSCW